MDKNTRILVFFAVLIILVIILVFCWSPLYNLGIPATVMISSLAMLSFVLLLAEPFFAKPADVIAANVSIILMLIPLQGELTIMGIWYKIFLVYNFALLIGSLSALLILDKGKASGHWRNKTSYYLMKFCTLFGNGKFLWYSLFVLTLLFYVDSQSGLFLILFTYSLVIVLIEPKKIILGFRRRGKFSKDEIGEIFGVQAENIFLAKLFKGQNTIERFDLVKFRYSQDSANNVRRGVVIEKQFLDEEIRIKILNESFIDNSDNLDAIVEKMRPNTVYKIPVEPKLESLDRLVGTVNKGSKIERLNFEYAKKIPVNEGNLLEVNVLEHKILYQVVQGIVDVEPLEDDNKAGLITGEASQLGIWREGEKSFERFGWVPFMSTPIYLAENIEAPTLTDGELQIGKIPGTNYPVVMNLLDAITHHLAILGVTGSGKSVFGRNIIKELAKASVRVICVDFTGEYRKQLAGEKIKPIVTEEISNSLFQKIDQLDSELNQYSNKQDPNKIKKYNDELIKEFSTQIKSFLSAPNYISLFELPDVVNTTAIFEYIKWFFKSLFEIAKNEMTNGKPLCVLLEEAHTVIPEWNFLGSENKRAQSVVNSISQIALQGRKYNVGFVVIAQRTANVSKTVLTQCNSVVAFRQTDKTAGDFLGNYMGDDFVQALSRLKSRQAIAVGKAIKGGIPIIFEVPEIDESQSVKNLDLINEIKKPERRIRVATEVSSQMPSKKRDPH